MEIDAYDNPDAEQLLRVREQRLYGVAAWSTPCSVWWRRRAPPIGSRLNSAAAPR